MKMNQVTWTKEEIIKAFDLANLDFPYKNYKEFVQALNKIAKERPLDSTPEKEIV